MREKKVGNPGPQIVPVPRTNRANMQFQHFWGPNLDTPNDALVGVLYCTVAAEATPPPSAENDAGEPAQP